MLLTLVEDGAVHEPQRNIVLFLAISLLYLAALLVLHHRAEVVRPSVWISWAVLFRLTAFWMPPLFTDDPYRYRWEGQVLLAGHNPYEHRPADPDLGVWNHPQVDGQQIKPVYGPVLQFAQAAAVWLGDGSLGGMKVPACAAELTLCWLLWRRLRDKRRLAIWAWCPLGIIEFWGMGHHDAVLVALALGAVFAAERERWRAAHVLLGLAAATKYWPALLWPLFARRGGHRTAWISPAVFTLCWLPFATDVRENARFLTGFGAGWRNNDVFFGALRTLAGTESAAKAALAALLVGVALWVAWKRWNPVAGYAAIALTLLLFSANLHPWYLTWLAPLAVFGATAPLTLWTALSPIYYLPLIAWRADKVWDGVSPWRWAAILPAVVALVIQLVERRRLGGSRPHGG